MVMPSDRSEPSSTKIVSLTGRGSPEMAQAAATAGDSPGSVVTVADKAAVSSKPLEILHAFSS